ELLREAVLLETALYERQHLGIHQPRDRFLHQALLLAERSTHAVEIQRIERGATGGAGGPRAGSGGFGHGRFSCRKKGASPHPGSPGNHASCSTLRIPTRDEHDFLGWVRGAHDSGVPGKLRVLPSAAYSRIAASAISRGAIAGSPG